MESRRIRRRRLEGRKEERRKGGVSHHFFVDLFDYILSQSKNPCCLCRVVFEFVICNNNCNIGA